MLFNKYPFNNDKSIKNLKANREESLLVCRKCALVKYILSQNGFIFSLKILPSVGVTYMTLFEA